MSPWVVKIRWANQCWQYQVENRSQTRVDGFHILYISFDKILDNLLFRKWSPRSVYTQICDYFLLWCSDLLLIYLSPFQYVVRLELSCIFQPWMLGREGKSRRSSSTTGIWHNHSCGISILLLNIGQRLRYELFLTAAYASYIGAYRYY